MSRAVGLGADLAECCLWPRCPRPLRRLASPLPTALSRCLLPFYQGLRSAKGASNLQMQMLGVWFCEEPVEGSHGVKLAPW